MPIEIIRCILIESDTKDGKVPPMSRTNTAGFCNLNLARYDRYANMLTDAGCLERDKRDRNVTTEKGRGIADKITEILRLLGLLREQRT